MGLFHVPFFENQLQVGYVEEGLTSVCWVTDQANTIFPKTGFEKEIAKQIFDYLNGSEKKFQAPIGWSHLKGTPFQQQVWRQLYKIPFGRVKTYGQIAQALKKPRAARAVGTACGKNPILLFIPCHRVVGASGLGGFSGGGLPVKKKLHGVESIQVG